MNHLQEIPSSGLHGTLSYNESPFLLVALGREWLIIEAKCEQIYDLHSQQQHEYNP